MGTQLFLLENCYGNGQRELDYLTLGMEIRGIKPIPDVDMT